MGKTMRMFLSGIANSLNPIGYDNIVSPSRKIGESASRINTKREKNQERIDKVAYSRITKITA